MKVRIRFLYGITSVCVLLYLCWNMATSMSPHLSQVVCQQLMKTEKDLELEKINKSVQRIQNTTTSSQNIVTQSLPTIVKRKDVDSAAINKFFTVQKFETKDSFIHLHQYVFSMGTQICVQNNFFLVMIVHSAPTNRDKRRLIRSTYGSVNSYKGRQLLVVFMLGAVNNQTLQNNLYRESELYGDIVQGNFLDTYQNLNRKHIMGMHWFVNYCKSQYILKLDDDTFVNPFRLIDFLVKEPVNETAMHCHIITNGKPIRSPKSKWYTPEWQYPFSVFPSFCLGFAYITTPRAWEAMYRASESRRLLDMDDVYVSLVLAFKAKVKKIQLEGLLTCHDKTTPMTVQQLNKISIVIDRYGGCGKRPFSMWNSLRDINT